MMDLGDNRDLRILETWDLPERCAIFGCLKK